MTKIAALTMLSLMFLSFGCVYKQNIQQGNPLTATDVAEVELGMTRAQVQFLLGTPLIEDPFHLERWDYVYFYRDGKTGTEFRRRFEVYFENNLVTSIIDLSTDP